MSSEPTVPPTPDTPPPAAPPGPGAETKFTKAAALWTALILGFLILIVLLIFIAQNTASTAFTFLGWHWTLPLGSQSCSPR